MSCSDAVSAMLNLVVTLNKISFHRPNTTTAHMTINNQHTAKDQMQYALSCSGVNSRCAKPEPARLLLFPKTHRHEQQHPNTNSNNGLSEEVWHTLSWSGVIGGSAKPEPVTVRGTLNVFLRLFTSVVVATGLAAAVSLTSAWLSSVVLLDS